MLSWARAQAALTESDLGALLLFDPNNIRYVTSTHIGEWARDKNARFALLPRNGPPILWDFGSAAKHHQLYAPWLPAENFRGGVSPMRGAGSTSPRWVRARSPVRAIPWTARRRPPSSASTGSRPTRSTRSQTATSWSR